MSEYIESVDEVLKLAKHVELSVQVKDEDDWIKDECVVYSFDTIEMIITALQMGATPGYMAIARELRELIGDRKQN